MLAALLRVFAAVHVASFVGGAECDGAAGSDPCYIKVGFFGEGGFAGVTVYDSEDENRSSLADLPACDRSSLEAYQHDWVAKVNSLNSGKGIGIKSGHKTENYFFKVRQQFSTFPTGKYKQADTAECQQLCQRWGVSDYRGLKYGKGVNFYQDHIPGRYKNKYMFDAQDYDSVKSSYGATCSSTPGAPGYVQFEPAFEHSDLSHLGHTDLAVFFGTRGDAEQVNGAKYCAGSFGSHNACKERGRLELQFTAHEDTVVVFGAQVFADGGQDDSFYIDVDKPAYAEGRKWNNNKGMTTEGGEWGLMPLERGAAPTQRVNGDTAPSAGFHVTKGNHTLYVKMREDGAWIRNVIIWRGNATFDGCNADMANCCDSDTSAQVPAVQFPEGSAEYQQCFNDCQLSGEGLLESFLPQLHFLHGLSACGVDQGVFMQYLETRNRSQQDGRLSRLSFAPSYFSRSDDKAFLSPLNGSYAKGMVGFPDIERRYTFSTARREDVWLRGMMQAAKNYGMKKVSFFGTGIPFIGILEHLQAERFLELDYKAFFTSWLPTENPEAQRTKAGMMGEMMRWRPDVIVMVWPFGKQHFPEYVARFLRFLKYFEAIHRPKAIIMPRLITDCCVGSSMPGSQNSWLLSYSPDLLGSTYEDALLPKSQFNYQTEFPAGIMNAQGQDLSTALQALQTAFQFKDITDGGRVSAADFLDDADNYEHLVDYFNTAGSNTIYANTVYGPIAFEKQHGRADEMLSQHGTTVQMDGAQEAQVVLPDRFQEVPLTMPSPATDSECPEDTFMKFDPVACPLCAHSCEVCPANTTTKGKKDANFRDCECQAGFYKEEDIRLYTHQELFDMGRQYCENGGQPKAFEWSKRAFLSGEKYYDTVLAGGPCDDSPHSSEYFPWTAGADNWTQLWSLINQTDVGYSDLVINGATKNHPLWNVMHFCDDLVQPDNVGDILLAGAAALKCQGYRCAACRPGWFLVAPGLAEVCNPCPDGSFAPGFASTSCTSCPAGQFSDRRAALGAASTSSGSRAGAADGFANAHCAVCGMGEYQDGSGSTACKQCRAPMITSTAGMKSAADCQCPPGYYARCEDHIDGLCADGSSACTRCGNGSSCSGLGRGPEAAPGFHLMAVTDKGLSILSCLGDVHRCPGGPVGACGANRDGSSPACGQCDGGFYEDTREDCAECAMVGQVLMVVVAIVAMVIVLASLVMLVNQDILVQHQSGLACAILASIACTTIQALGTFNQLAIEWVEPLKTVFATMSLLSFDLKVFQLECFLGSGPLLTYFARQLIAPVCVAVVPVLVAAKRAFRDAQTDLRIESVNSIGALMKMMFMSVVLSSLLPFICYGHPDGNGASMVSDPSAICWTEGSHQGMMAIGIVAFGLVVCPFLGIVIYATCKYRAIVRDAFESTGSPLHMYRFIFMNFTASAYWYGLATLVRSLLVCLTPVIFQDDPSVQLLAMSAVLLGFFFLQAHVQPWRTPIANLTDGVLSVILLLLLDCTDDRSSLRSSSKTIGVMATALFITLVICLVTAIGMMLTQRVKPVQEYHSFISHHKAHAAAQARFLQLALQSYTGRKVFLDSDHLQNLDDLFNVVRVKIGMLVALLTSETLRRPWCAGEVVICHQSHKRAVVIRCPSFATPKPEFFASLGTHLRIGEAGLIELGIGAHHIVDAYKWLLGDSVQQHEIDPFLPGRSRFESVAGHCLSEMPKRQISPPVSSVGSEKVVKPGMVVVSSDPADDEATAAAGILIHLGQERIMSLTSTGSLVLADRPELEEESVVVAIKDAVAVIVVLSHDTLSCAEQLQVMMMTMQLVEAPTEKLGPFGLIPLSIPSFSFPTDSDFDQIVPRMLVEDTPKAKSNLQAFFKRISVALATSDAAEVINVQVSQVVARIPNQKHTGQRSRSVRLGALRLSSRRLDGEKTSALTALGVATDSSDKPAARVPPGLVSRM